MMLLSKNRIAAVAGFSLIVAPVNSRKSKASSTGTEVVGVGDGDGHDEKPRPVPNMKNLGEWHQEFEY